MLVGWKAAVNDRKIASMRYRVETPVRALQALGHSVEVFDPHRADEYDVVIFAKTYSVRDRALAGRVRARGGRVVFDLCDNHFYNPRGAPKYRQVREELLDMLSLAQDVVCTTPCLAEVVREEAPWAAPPIVIGDAVDRLEPTRPSLEPFDGLRLLWFGSHGSPNASAGMGDILLVKDHLIAAAARRPLELVVCSNSREKFDEHIAPLPFATRYVDWTLDGFPGVLSSADAVIIPISPNPFTACKTHNRLSMSLHAGKPVIADAIESYREFAPFCTLDDWAGGLHRLTDDLEAEQARASGAREYIEQHWTTAALALKWQDALGLRSASASAPVFAAQALAAATAPAAAPVRANGGGNGHGAGHEGERAAPAMAALPMQGALDHRGVGAISGWVRAPSEPGRRLKVRLEHDGRILTTGVADQVRPDLAAAGFSDAACGFSLVLGDDAGAGPFEVVVEETGWRFDRTPFHLSGAPDGSVRLTSRAGPAPQPLIPLAPAPAGELSAFAAAGAREVQAELLGELERLNALMDEARDAAARLVVAAGDDVALGRRLLGMFKRELKPDLTRVLRWSEDDERRQAPLN